MTDPKPEQCVCGHVFKDHNDKLECLVRSDPYGEYCPCDLFEPPNAPQPARAVERMPLARLAETAFHLNHGTQTAAEMRELLREAYRARAREAELERDVERLREALRLGWRENERQSVVTEAVLLALGIPSDAALSAEP